MEKIFLKQKELSKRWGLSDRTLERWRWLGQGPAFLKIGGRVLYRLDDIIAYETNSMRISTSDIGGHYGTINA